jgi:hypothetical protein
MLSIRHVFATGCLVLCATATWAAAPPPPNPPPPRPQADANDPVTAKCREGLAQALQSYGIGHPGAPDKLSKRGDLSYDQATEYMARLNAAFLSIKATAFRRDCEPRLRDPATLATHYVNAYEKMESRLDWYGQAMDKHCAGHGDYSRSQGKHWLGKYKLMKAEAARIENSKSVLDDLVDEASERGDVRVTRACRAFGGSQVGAKLKALGERCREEMKEYEAARSTCEGVCKPMGKTAQCNVFSQ